MTDQNIDPIDALPKFNAFTIYDVLIHLRPDLAEASSIPGGEFDKAGLPMFGGCYVCGAGIAAYNACPGKNGYLVGKCCANAHNVYGTVEEFLASRPAPRERSALCACCESPCFPRGNMEPDLCEDCAYRLLTQLGEAAEKYLRQVEHPSMRVGIHDLAELRKPLAQALRAVGFLNGGDLEGGAS